MKYTFCLFALVCTLSGVRSQITLTDGYFPRAGDSLLTNQAHRSGLTDVTFQAPGADLKWDFGYPELQYTYTELIEAVTGDTVFTTADSRMSSAAFRYEYFQATPTEYRLVGLVGSLPFFRDLVLSTPLSPPRTLRRAGITYGDRFEDLSVQTITLSVDSLPAEIRSSAAGAMLANFDSVRVTSTSERQDEVDAWGSLQLEGHTYEVLREKRVERMETQLAVKTGDGPFLDITALVLEADPTYDKYLGPQPAEGTYYFWAQDIREPVVEIEFNEEEAPTTFLYKRGGLGTSVRPDPVVSELAVYPNPVAGDFRLSFTLARADVVTFTLLDALGRVLRPGITEHRPAGEQGWEATLRGCPRGTYLAEIKTSTGRSIKKILK